MSIKKDYSGILTGMLDKIPQGRPRIVIGVIIILSIIITTVGVPLSETLLDFYIAEQNTLTLVNEENNKALRKSLNLALEDAVYWKNRAETIEDELIVWQLLVNSIADDYAIDIYEEYPNLTSILFEPAIEDFDDFGNLR